MVNEYIKAYVAYLILCEKKSSTTLLKRELLLYRAQGLFQQLTKEDIPELEKVIPSEAKRLRRILDAIAQEQIDKINNGATLPWEIE